MKNKALQWFGMVLIIQVGLFHLYQAPGEFGVSRFLGVLFAAIFIAALIATLRILDGEAWGWTLGAIVSAGSAVLFAWSGAVGFPGLERENLLNPLGLISLAVEFAFIVVFILKRADRGTALGADPAAAISSRGRMLIPAAAFLMLFAVSLTAYRIDITIGEGRTGLRTTPITQESLANEYGISVSQAAITAMDSIIDLRLRIFDAKKAGYLLGNPHMQPYLLVGDNPAQVILPAHTGHHGHMIHTGGLYQMYFPNPLNSLKPGTRISLVFGDLRLDSVVLK